MRLIQAKVRCADGIHDSGWFVPGKETTLIFGPVGSGITDLLQALQWLNPIYEKYPNQREYPFLNHPSVWRQGAHVRMLLPEKKTAIFMVFSAEAQHALELEKITPELLEIDRVEVGRRLDYSRWMTFVEISASSRWSEIESAVFTLQSNLPEADLQSDFLFNRKPTDRLKGSLADQCRHWLEAITPYVPPEKTDLLQHCLYIVNRNMRFKKAQKKVDGWLPRTVYLHPDFPIKSFYTFSEISKVYLSSSNTSSGPVEKLLGKLCEDCKLIDGKEHEWQKLQERVSLLSQDLRDQGLIVPEIIVSAGGIQLSGCEPLSSFDQRILLMSATCILSELGYGVTPLLLLDRFDSGLTSSDELRLVQFIQNISQRYQLIISTSNKGLRDAGGWQSLLTVGHTGLAGGPLLMS